MEIEIDSKIRMKFEKSQYVIIELRLRFGILPEKVHAKECRVLQETATSF